MIHVETLMEKNSIALLSSFQMLYLEQHDTYALTNALGTDITWLGTGVREVFDNHDDVLNSICRNQSEPSIRISLKGSWSRARQLDDCTCLVYGEFSGEIEDRLCDFDDILLRYTAVCRLINDELKLIHMHVSCPDKFKTNGELHVKKFVRRENTRLKKMVERAANIIGEKEDDLRNLSDKLPCGIHQCIYDNHLTIVSANSGFLDLLGYSKDELLKTFKNHFIEMIYENDRNMVMEALGSQLNSGDIVEIFYRVRRKDGELVWVWDRGRAVEGCMGTMFYCAMFEITEQQHRQDKLISAVERYKVILDQCTDIIFEWDIHEDSLFLSSNWYKKFGYLPLSKDISKTILTSENVYSDDVHVFEEFIQNANSGVSYREADVRLWDNSSSYRWYRIRCTTQFDNDKNPLKVIGVIIDINDEKLQKTKLMEQASRDTLTKLYNKKSTESLVEAILQSETDSHALLIVDVDNFKDVNDKYGHLCGDAVLTTLSLELQNIFRSTDIIGRIGGDEFLVFMADILSIDDVKKRASEVVQILNNIKLNIDIELSCSVGIALYNRDAKDYIGLMNCADKALYSVKSRGKASYAFYDSKMMGVQFPANTRTNEEYVEGESVLSPSRMMVEYVFKLLSSSSDTEEAINKMLELVGKMYGVSRMYVFEVSDDQKKCSNTFEWCNENIVPQIDKLQNMDFERDLTGFFDCYDDSGIFYCQNVDLLRENLRNFLKSQNIIAMLQCQMRDGNIFRGYVGFDECCENRYWTKDHIETLRLISSITWVFISKLRLQQRLEESQKQLKKLRGELVGTK